LPGISFTSFGGLNDPTPRRELDQTYAISDTLNWESRQAHGSARLSPHSPEFRSSETPRRFRLHRLRPVEYAPVESVGDGVGLIQFARGVGSLRPPKEVKLMPGKPQSKGSLEMPVIPAPPGPATSVVLE